MIQYITGNLIEAPEQALVNTVNTVGVMGKGIALQFKEAFPQNFHAYRQACKTGELTIGNLFVYKETTLTGEKIIINFPTKKDWKNKSQYEYIEKGLADLKEKITKYNIQSIAIPPLGCGNGGLDWNTVKALIEKYLSPLKDVTITIYEPTTQIKAILQKENTKKEIKLTPARALILYAMFYYEMNGETSSLFVANKLAYFMQRLGMPDFQKLNFTPYHYGPYSVGVEHMLYTLNGTYLKGLEQNHAKAFENIYLDYDKKDEVSTYIHTQLPADQTTKLKSLIKLITGFETSFSLEILSSVDYILTTHPEYALSQITTAIQQWSERKKELFQEKYIKIAYDHLQTQNPA